MNNGDLAQAQAVEGQDALQRSEPVLQEVQAATPPAREPAADVTAQDEHSHLAAYHQQMYWLGAYAESPNSENLEHTYIPLYDRLLERGGENAETIAETDNWFLDTIVVHRELATSSATRSAVPIDEIQHDGLPDTSAVVENHFADIPDLIPSAQALRAERARLTRIPVHRSALQRQRQLELASFGGRSETQNPRTVDPFTISSSEARRAARSPTLNPLGLPYTNLRFLASLYQQGMAHRRRELAEREREKQLVIRLAMVGALSDHLDVMRQAEDEENEAEMPAEHSRSRNPRWYHLREIRTRPEADLQSRGLCARFDLGVSMGIREWCISRTGDLRYWRAWVRAGRWVHGIRFNVEDLSFEILQEEDEIERLTDSRMRWNDRADMMEMD